MQRGIKHGLLWESEDYDDRIELLCSGLSDDLLDYYSMRGRSYMSLKEVIGKYRSLMGFELICVQGFRSIVMRLNEILIPKGFLIFVIPNIRDMSMNICSNIIDHSLRGPYDMYSNNYDIDMSVEDVIFMLVPIKISDKDALRDMLYSLCYASDKDNNDDCIEISSDMVKSMLG